MAVAAGLALLNKSTGRCARKSRPAQVPCGPVVKSPAPQGEPHHIIHALLRQEGTALAKAVPSSQTFLAVATFNLYYCKSMQNSQTFT